MVNVVIGALIYTMVGFIITVSDVSTFLDPLFTGPSCSWLSPSAAACHFWPIDGRSAA